MKRIFSLLLILAGVSMQATGATVKFKRAFKALKPRVVVLTDIAPSNVEPDDMESVIRLLAYADQFEIEAIVASSGWNTSGRNIDYPVGWMDSLTTCINAYEKDLPNLMKRSSQESFLSFEKESGRQEIGYWPSADYLRSRAMLGSVGLSASRLGKDNDSDGSNQIIKLLQENDPRPLWVLAWGGANTLGQAVWRMKQMYDEKQWRKMLEKLCVYTITDQDVIWSQRKNYLTTSHHWMRKECGESLRFIWDESAWRTQNEISGQKWDDYATHIQGHGHMGKVYPTYLVRHGVEGDTPSLLHVMPNGLNDPMAFDQVGWGGYFKWGLSNDKQTSCYTNYQTDVKSISRKYEEEFYYKAFYDFAARMDWAKDGAGNRNPIVLVNKKGGIMPLHIGSKPGKEVSLDGSKSYDWDGDALSYKWWTVPEAGTYKGDVTISNAQSDKAKVVVPADAKGKTIHVVCEVSDNGTPSLITYKRIIIEVK